MQQIKQNCPKSYFASILAEMAKNQASKKFPKYFEFNYAVRGEVISLNELFAMMWLENFRGFSLFVVD